MATYSATPISNIPIPDPSEITSREIAKAKVELREEFKLSDSVIKESNELARSLIRDIIETRLTAMDVAATVLADNVNRVPTLLDRESLRLEKLFEEKLNGMQTKFDGIQIQFRERDIRTDQDKIAATTAVNAALQAQKEAAGAQNMSNAAAITKSENSFTKEIDGLKSLINTVRDAIQSDVANLTGRMDRGEGGAVGAKQQVTSSQASLTSILGVVGGVVGVLSLVGMIVFGISHSGGNVAAPAAVAVAPLNPSAFSK